MIQGNDHKPIDYFLSYFRHRHCIRKIFNVYHVHIDNYEIEKYQIDSVFSI